MTLTIRRVIPGAWSLALSALFLLPLASLFSHSGVPLPVQALVVSLTILSAAAPGAGLVGLAVLVPLSLALEIMLWPEFATAQWTEALVFAFVAGAAWRAATPAPRVRDWLGRPALVLASLIVTSAIVDLAGLQAADPSRHLAAELWRHVTGDFFFSERPFVEFHQTTRWLSDLALAVFAERILRRAPAFRAVTVRMWLVGGAAGACFAALRISEILMRNPGHRMEMLKFVLRTVRITALHPDVNAAGSYFALFVVAAIVLGLSQRAIWILVGVLPLVLLAFVLAQSRAAIAAVALVLGLVWLIPLLKARRLAAAAAFVVVLTGLVSGAWIVVRASHAGVGTATMIRVQMAQVALHISRDHPVFGVGIGRYVAASRPYISNRVAALQEFAPSGENAHNNFLEILAELGLPGLLAFLWLVLALGWPPKRAAEANATVKEARALSAGLAAFLLSALLGHPLLVPDVQAIFFIALGIAAGVRAAPTRFDGAGRLVSWTAVGLLVILLPWRIAHEFAPDPGETTGVGPVIGVMDDVHYRAALPSSTWRVPVSKSMIELPLRWAAPADSNCQVVVVFDGHEADRLTPVANAWTPLQFQLTSAKAGVTVRELELRVPDARCHLLVGPLQAR